ncbi:NucA/NucB deoxyribonuclease domain-containing protein [Actinopolyspora sp. H202]|uniref:NucA/NucB deoxyribonuclease domain-containing protein n=1 Tax=Actinopolyspora sp. H202 TaxID=1500456 RepID=UPI003EE709ED
MQRGGRGVAVLAAAALLVLMPAGTAAGQESGRTPSSAPPGKGPRHQQQTWLINDPELVANPQRVVDTLRRTGSLDTLGVNPVTDMKGPVSYQQQPASYTVDSDRFPGGTKPADPYQYITEQECAANGQAVREQGWIKNRFSYCQRTLMVRRHLRCGPRGCRLVGLFIGRPTVLGHGKHGGYPEEPTDRWAHFEFQLNPLLVTGPYRGADFTVRFHTDGEYPDGGDWFADPCKIGEKDGRDDSLRSWMASDGAEIDLVSEADAPSAEQGEEIATCTFHPVYDFDMPGWDADQPIHGYESGMRFDSAWYLASSDSSRQLGSVFDRTTPGMVYRRDDTPVAGVADHIGDARANPSATVPSRSDKTLEGASPQDTLRRLAPGAGQAQQDRYAANRRVVRNFCRSSNMPPKPGPGRYDCDEYAFASTYEGAARHNYEGSQHEGHYSVRWVDRDQNQEAGRRLGRWYINQRILDSDEFFVPIR